LANRRRALPPAAAWRSRLLFVQPHVFHAPAVVDAVAHDRQAFDIGLTAVAGGKIHDDRPNALLGQFALDLPNQGLALFLVRLHRLPVDHLVELGIAVLDVVPFGAARIVLVKILIWIIDAIAGEIERYREILAVKARKPLRRVDRLEFAVYVDLLQLVYKDNRGVAEERQVARRHLDRQALVRAVAELAHDLAGFLAVLGDLGLVAGQGVQHLQRHAPDAFRRRLHDPADIALALGENVEKGLPVKAQGHRPSQFSLVERRNIAVDHQIAADI